MTVEHFITRFVYQFKEISLQGIGIIKLDDAVPDIDFLQKHKAVPISALTFTHKTNVPTTPEFIKYYSEMRGKIKSLAENDVEAYLSMAMQFLNIGNPVEIKGLGTLNKQKDGSLVMTPGYFLAMKEEDNTNRFRDRVNVEEESGPANFFGKKEQESSKSAKMVIGLLIAVLILVGGWWLYSSFLKSTPSTPAATENAASDTLLVPRQDTTPVAPTTTVAAPVAATVDSSVVKKWKAVFREEADKATAITVMNNYKRVKAPIVMETADSVNFIYYVLLETSLRDASYKTDSLARFFARPVKLVPIN